tara:strand:- start:658 stop:1197 length:540 start_codon:yes stop_codon:yes gene_type:complete
MGVDKSKIIIENKSLIEIAVENLIQADITEIIISVRSQEQAGDMISLFGNKITTIIDQEKGQGIWDVLKFALPPNQIVQILPVDSPWFDSNAIQLMEREFKKNQEIIGVVPWSDNGPEPLLMQINSSKFLNLISNKNPMPLRKLVDNDDFQAIDSKIIENEIGHENALRNLNRPGDLIF